MSVRAPSAAEEPSRLTGAMSIFLALTLGLIFSGGWQIFVLGPDAPPGDSPLARAVYLPGYGAALLLVLRNPGPALRAAARTPLVWSLLILAVLSSAWSIDPDMTLRRAAALAATTLAGLALASAFDWAELTEVLALVFGVLCAASLLVALVAPDLGRMTELFPGAWRGVWNEKNALGLHMGLSALLSLGAAGAVPRRRVLWLAVAALGLLLLGLSTSRTALIAFAGGLGAFLLVGAARRGPASAIAAVFLLVSAGFAGALILNLGSDWIFGLLGKDPTLTGRTGVWGPVIRQAAARPLFGYGYGAVWDDQGRWGPLAWIVKEAQFRPREAHDIWLAVWLELGAVGLVLWSLLVLDVWRRTLATTLRIKSAVVAAPLVTFLAIAGISESTPLQYNDLIWVLFTALAFRLARREPHGVEAGTIPTRQAPRHPFAGAQPQSGEALCAPAGPCALERR